MSYDLYLALGGSSREDAEAVVRGNYQNTEIIDIATRIRLLAGLAARNQGMKDYAVSGDRNGGGYKSLVHASEPKKGRYAKELVAGECKRLEALGLLKPAAPDLQRLPLGSWFLHFTFTLAKPWLSRDDDPFYVAESVNPVRKDKAFKVPLMSAAAWKGLLHWTVMHTRLVLRKDELSDEAFAQGRFRQTLLFGTEKGEEPGGAKGFAAFLDDLKPGAKKNYRSLVKEHFGLGPDEAEMPHYRGRLSFYPTFFDLIDVEVINPHLRKTRAGTRPIYLECVPATASGAFSLLYVPFDLIGREGSQIRKQAAEDLCLVAGGIQAMMLTYGFSAKRTSGYGAAEDEIRGVLKWRDDKKLLSSLSKLVEEVGHVTL